LLPAERVVTRRGGIGNEFYTPGDDSGGAWGSGQNWPLEEASGSPLPDDPKLRRMWKLFWGEDFNRILPSNRKNVMAGSWRIEVSPAKASHEDFFLHVLEIGDAAQTGKARVELLDGVSVKGAAFERGPIVLFNSTDSALETAEVSLPEMVSDSLLLTGLRAHATYELNLSGLNVSSSPTAVLPGVSAGILRVRANLNGVIRIEKRELAGLRLRLNRI
jgi:hypothetical protein